MTMTSGALATLDVQPGDAEAVDQVEQWFHDYDASHDPAVRERIILAHLGLADRLAARFRGSRGISEEDLVQSARVGLVKAVDRYDPQRPNPFIVYAVVCITGEVKRFLRDCSWRLRVARSHKEYALQVVKVRDALTVTLGRAPTVAEVADHLGTDQEVVVQGLEAIEAWCVASLDEPIDADGNVSMGALLAAPAPAVEIDDLLVLPELIGILPDQERRAVMLRFFDDLHQGEIGAVLGCSQMHVSRLLRRAVLRMRERLCC
jgi:RNA polymerase sigma-B factor